jgi:hypothetical protein
LEIQEEFRTKTGLLVDVPKPGCGNTNYGNKSRKSFSEPELAGAIRGVDVNLIYRFKVILEFIPSGNKINTEKYSKYATDTAEMYVRLYPWHPMTPTMHNILIHGAILIENALPPPPLANSQKRLLRHVINISAYTDKTLQGNFLGCLPTLM